MTLDTGMLSPSGAPIPTTNVYLLHWSAILILGVWFGGLSTPSLAARLRQYICRPKSLASTLSRAYCFLSILLVTFTLVLSSSPAPPSPSLDRAALSLLRMLASLALPTLFFALAARCRRPSLVLLFELLALAAVWLPWHLDWLPRVSCMLSRGQSFPLTHLLMIDAVAFSVCVVYHLPNIDLSLAHLRSLPGVLLALFAALAAILVTLPLGLAFGVFHSAYNPWRPLPLYIAKFLECYALIALTQEILFRGLLQNLCENRLGLFLDEHLNFRGFNDDEPEDPQPPPLEPDEPPQPPHRVIRQPPRDFSFHTHATRKPQQAWISLVLTSLAFSVANVHREWRLLDAHPGVGQFLIYFVQGLIYGWVWRQSRSVSLSALTNAICLLFWYSFFGADPTPA